MADDYRKGFWLTLAGVLAFTPDALLIRLSAVDPFTLACGRGLMAGAVLLLGYRISVSGGFARALRLLGGWGILFAGLQACASLTFYASFSYRFLVRVHCKRSIVYTKRACERTTSCGLGHINIVVTS